MIAKFVRFFTYSPGIPSGIGVGAGRMGLEKPQTDPLYAPYDLRNTVRGDLGPLSGGFNKMVQDVTPVSIKGSGTYLTGAIALQALAQFNAGKS